ncbi:hypothetical protein [Streptomyces sp. NPDC014733]|uniref:hypothetical protein n=1 Tax=Streptomyces sp. NPDC014733 TaxID=3364885 RepID=UPI003700907C
MAALFGLFWLTGKGTPLADRSEALATAQKQVRAVAADAGIGISGRYNPSASYEACGRRGVPAPAGGQFTLTYTAYADLPDRMHIAALRRLRSALERQDGVKVTAYEERPQVQEAQLDADGPDRLHIPLHIAVASAKPPHTVRLAVTTDCLQPPTGR